MSHVSHCIFCHIDLYFASTWIFFFLYHFWKYPNVWHIVQEIMEIRCKKLVPFNQKFPPFDRDSNILGPPFLPLVRGCQIKSSTTLYRTSWTILVLCMAQKIDKITLYNIQKKSVERWIKIKCVIKERLIINSRVRE